MRRLSRWLLALVVISVAPAAKAEAAELRGSRASMKRQHTVAVESGYAFAKRPSDVRRLVEEGQLVELEGNEDYDVSLVRYPYALPEVRTLIERLSQQYRRATGEKLVVTSLVRPTTRQPANAHPLSVHPAGMAVDLRVPRNPASRRWLESTLLSLEAKGVLDVTREYRPPHFHVAVFPGAYREYVERRLAAEAAARTEEPQPVETPRPAPAANQASAAAPAPRDAPAWVASLALLFPVATATGARALRARRRGRGGGRASAGARRPASRRKRASRRSAR
jgi:hypothetical protein